VDRDKGQQLRGRCWAVIIRSRWSECS